MKIFALFVVFIFSATIFAGECEIGPWRLGMSKEKVCSFTEFRPYNPVIVTGGVETTSAFFDGKKRRISFVFDDAGLKFIQIWYYAGHNSSESLDGMIKIYHLFKTQYGGGQITTRKAPDKYADDVTMRHYLLQQLFRFKRNRSRNRQQYFLITPGEQPGSSKLTAKWYLDFEADIFYAFLFQDRTSLAYR